MTRRRLDAEMVRRGLSSSRSQAQEAIRAGFVMVGGSPADKAATLVSADAPLGLTAEPRRFVSRGGDKLDGALDRFCIDPTGRLCLDAGASTGGFTDRLLKGGAARVVALDVGYGQLAWEIRNDPRVVVMERTNVRDLTAAALPFAPQLVVADLSFISLRAVLPALVGVGAPEAEFVLLVKPQFEAGRRDVGRGGVVRDSVVWRRVLEEVSDALSALDAGPLDSAVSPLRGPAGNVEFFVYGRRGGITRQLDLDRTVAEAEALE
jgi:23S rRNA (cytidine1920-2'-O)/16S rRNA (cytidine1409-2'-O)-methyltransferase